MITPREILRDFCAVLNLLYQNPDATYESIVQKTVTLAHAAPGEEEQDAKETPASAAPQEKSTVTFADLDF